MELFYSVIPMAILFFFFPFVLIYLIGDSKFSEYFIDVPDKRKVHSIHIPRVGGFCILIGFFLTIFVLIILKSAMFSFWLEDSVGKSIILSAAIIFIIGFLDDTTFFEVGAMQKMLVQFVVGAAVVFGFGLYVSELNFFGRIYELGYLGEILTIIWIVGVMNAFNIIDGVDGLLSGLVLVSLTVATILFLLVGGANQNYIIITIPMIAIVFAFLKYNYSPAVIFAGDSGSLFFGAIAAILSVKIGTFANMGIESFSVFYIVALPVIEVLVSMVRRYYHGGKEYRSVKEKLKQMLIPDNRHMHHRLINKGYNHERTMTFLIFLSFLFALCSIILSLSANSAVKIGTILYSVFVLVRIVDYLGYLKGFSKEKNRKSDIERYIFVSSGNEYFEKSVYSAANDNYRVEKFEKINEEQKNKNVESFVIYNENDDFAKQDIEKISEIRKLFNSAIFFVSSKETLSKCSHILENEKNIYFIEKPVDITMLIHNIDKFSFSGEIYGGVYSKEDQKIDANFAGKGI